MVITVMINFFLLVFTGGLCYFTIRILGFSVYNILYVFTFFWLFLIIGAQSIMDTVLELDFLILMYSIPWVFMVVSLVVKVFIMNNIMKDNGCHEEYDLSRVKVIIYILFLLCIIANILYVYEEYFLKGIDFSVIGDIRSPEFQIEKEDPSVFYNIFGRIYLLVLPWFYLLYKNKGINKLTFIFVIVLSVILSALFLTRAPILILFIYILLCNFYFFEHDFVYKVNRFLILLAVSFFVLITVLIENVDNSLNSFMMSFTLYIFGGIGAFQKMVAEIRYDDGFLYSFDFIYYILRKLGFISHYPSYIRDYCSYGGFTTNVYTFLDCYFIDFGFLGVYMGCLVLFAFTSFVYYVFIFRRKIYYFQFYLLFFSNLMMCFMNNEFIRISFFIFLFEIFLLKSIVSTKINFKRS